MLDHAKIKKLLDHFKDLPADTIDFNQASYFLNDDADNRPCVFARAAHVLGGDDWQITDTSPDGTTRKYWHYLDGVPLMCDAFDMYQDDLRAALHNNGAPMDSFMLHWDNNPYDVLLKTYQQRCQELSQTPI